MLRLDIWRRNREEVALGVLDAELKELVKDCFVFDKFGDCFNPFFPGKQKNALNGDQMVYVMIDVLDQRAVDFNIVDVSLDK